MIHLTTVSAAQLGRSKIRVNAICPGLILTDIFTSGARAMGAPDAMLDMIRENMAKGAPDAQPIPKGGLPADIAKACLLFARLDDSRVRHRHASGGRWRHDDRSAPRLGPGRTGPPHGAGVMPPCRPPAQKLEPN